MEEVMRRARGVRLTVFDVDGVLTDGRLLLSESGEEYKAFHVHDGQGLVMLRDSGVRIAVISGRSSYAVESRMAALGIMHVFQGNSEKLRVFQRLLKDLSLQASEVAYLGDDLPDLPVMLRVGLPAAVADAHPLVLKHAQWQTRNPGGRGAARELCELIMEAQGTLAAQYAPYLEPRV